jgi:YggT family protein
LAIIVALLYVYLALIFGRMLLSWFPINGEGMAKTQTFLVRATEPVLGPIRRALPNTGGVDFSPMVVMVVILLIASLL